MKKFIRKIIDSSREEIKEEIKISAILKITNYQGVIKAYHKNIKKIAEKHGFSNEEIQEIKKLSDKDINVLETKNSGSPAYEFLILKDY